MKALATLALLAACASDPKPIEISMKGTQALVVEKIDRGAWKPVTGSFEAGTNRTMYSIEIGDELELVVVCLYSGALEGQFVAEEVFATRDDADLTFGSWRPPNCTTAPNGDPIRVSGTFDEQMSLAVDGGYTFPIFAGAPFSQASHTGLHDVVAYSNTKIAIVRDIEMDADTVLDPIHLARDGGQVLQAIPPLTPDPDEEVTLFNSFVTRNGTSYAWQASAAGALFVPPELLEPGR